MKIYAARAPEFDFSSVEKFVGKDYWIGVENEQAGTMIYINFADLSNDSVTYTGISRYLLTSDDISMTQRYYDSLMDALCGRKFHTALRSQFAPGSKVCTPIDLYTTDELLDILKHNVTIMDYTPAMYSGDIEE
jgi:hypothetical protein